MMAQSAITWQEFVEQFFYDNTDESTQYTEELYDQLLEFHNNPIDLNTTTVDQLIQLPFISEEQAQAIIQYRDRNKPIFSLGELMFITQLNRQERLFLHLFCTANPTEYCDTLTTRKLIRNIRHQAIIRGDIPFYTKAGQKHYSDSILARYPNRAYKGDRFYTSLRYNISSMNHLFAGIQAEKDAGEKGIDYLAGYAQLKDIRLSRNVSIENIIIGNYKINYGLGLTVSNAFSMGKSTTLFQGIDIDKGISRHSSTSEYNHFTGAATAIRIHDFTVSAFCSYSPLDATLRNDSSGISSLKTDGLHRTQLERSKHHNTFALNIGGNIQYRYKTLKLSLSAVHTKFSLNLSPEYTTPSTRYRYFNAAGKHFQAYSISYSWKIWKLKLIGETALSRQNGINNPQTGIATLNTLQYRPNSDNIISLTYRQYGAKFTSINGNTFSENSSPKNETGICLAWQSSQISALDINAYVDLIHFPWIKYQVSKPSYGLDASLQLNYRLDEKTTLGFRYHVKSKQKDFKLSTLGGEFSDSDEKVLQYNNRHTLRLQFSHQFSKNWNIRTTVNATLLKFSIHQTEKGFSISQQAQWKANKDKLSITLAATYFNTDSYDTRTYNYEPSLLYAYGFHSYYYHGIRPTLLANIPIGKHIVICAKASSTIYFNQNAIGSSTELIDTNHREDLQLQLRWKY